MVCPRFGGHAACAPDPGHAPRRCHQDARDRRRSGRDGAPVQGRVLGRARRRSGAQRVGGLAVRSAPDPRLRADEGSVRPGRPDEPGQDRAHLAHGRQPSVSLQAGPRGEAAAHRTRLVGLECAGRPGHGGHQRAGHRRRSVRGLRQGRRDVQQQWPLPQVRCRHDVPELPGHPQRTAPHPGPRQHAAPGAERPVGPRRAGLARDARLDEPVRELQGLQARLPDRGRHGAHEDRVHAPLAAPPRTHAARKAGGLSAPVCRCGLAFRRAAEPARQGARNGAPERAPAGLVRAAQPAGLAAPDLPAGAQGG